MNLRQSFRVVTLAALLSLHIHAEPIDGALFATAKVRSVIAEINMQTSGGDWYEANDGGVFRKAELALESHYFVSHKLLDPNSALAGLKDPRTYVRVICKEALKELLQRDLDFPHLQFPDSKVSHAAFRRIEKRVHGGLP